MKARNIIEVALVAVALVVITLLVVLVEHKNQVIREQEQEILKLQEDVEYYKERAAIEGLINRFK